MVPLHAPDVTPELVPGIARDDADDGRERSWEARGVRALHGGGDDGDASLDRAVDEPSEQRTGWATEAQVEHPASAVHREVEGLGERPAAAHRLEAAGVAV